MSKIEWTEKTWNPVTGCTKVSAGCKHCYAERMAKRLQSMGNQRYEQGFEIAMHDDLVDAPKRWRKKRLVFVNSMSDLFHEQIHIEFVKRVFQTMNDCPQHVFQILTKRSERLLSVASQMTWTENIWMGVSVEDSRFYKRIDDLVKVPAKIRFLSCEPLIAPMENLPLKGVHWVIVGGESGPGARLMKPEWVHSIKHQCQQSKVAFFFKQWGGVNKRRNGRILDNKTYDEMPATH